MTQKNYEVAILYFKNAMQKQPKEAEPYYQLGLAYLASGDVGTAASYLRKASELNPRHTGAQLKLAELDGCEPQQGNGGGGTEAHTGRFEFASGRCRGAEPSGPDGTPPWESGERGSAPRTGASKIPALPAIVDRSGPVQAGAPGCAGRRGSAQAGRRPGTEMQPIPGLLGRVLPWAGQNGGGGTAVPSALEIDPKHGPALLALGAMQVRAGHPEQAEQTYRQLSALPDKRYKPLHALFLFRSGKRDAALVEFEKLAKEDPADRDARTWLVRGYLAMKRTGDAEKVLTAALKKNELDTDALLQRSRIYLGSGGNYPRRNRT